MSTIAVAKIGMGYQPATQRPSCCNCKHGNTGAEHPPRWRCTKGGFLTTAMATCNQHAAEYPTTPGDHA